MESGTSTLLLSPGQALEGTLDISVQIFSFLREARNSIFQHFDLCGQGGCLDTRNTSEDLSFQVSYGVSGILLRSSWEGKLMSNLASP